jgi:hypothetical protein
MPKKRVIIEFRHQPEIEAAARSLDERRERTRQQADCFLIGAPPIKTRVFTRSGPFSREGASICEAGCSQPHWPRFEHPMHDIIRRSLIAGGCASSPGAPTDIAAGSTVLSGVGTPSTP